MPSIQKVFSPSTAKLDKADLNEIVLELSKNLYLVPGELRTIFMERETASGAAEQRLLNFIEEKQLKIIGYAYEELLLDEISVKGYENYMTQIMIHVEG